MRLNQKILKEMINKEVELLFDEDEDRRLAEHFTKQIAELKMPDLESAMKGLGGQGAAMASKFGTGSMQKILDVLAATVSKASLGKRRILVAQFLKKLRIPVDELMMIVQSYKKLMSTEEPTQGGQTPPGATKEPAPPDTPLEERRRKRKITRRSK